LPIHLKKSDQYLELVFADNGIGFEEMFSEKIFASFKGCITKRFMKALESGYPSVKE